MLACKILLILNFLLLCQLGLCHGDDAYNTEFGIEFYGGENYTELLYKVNTNTKPKCQNFQMGSRKLNVRSVNTTECWILHGDPNCQSVLSEKVTANVSWDSIHEIGSFQHCGEEIGGPTLRVDLTDYYEDKNHTPNVLKSYKDVCGCIDIPDNIKDMDKWSINNYGNDVVAYYEPGCEEKLFKALNIPAGYSKEAREIYKYEKSDSDQIDTDSVHKVQSLEQILGNPNEKVYKIQSFGPNFNSSYFKNSCLKFNATVLKFEIDDRAEFEESDLEIEMFNNVFRNDRSNRLSSTYFVSKEVQETFHVERDLSLDDMENVMVDPDFEVESNFDQNVFKEQAIREVLRKAYSINRDKTTLNAFKTFSVKQVMNVPPCTEHKVNAHVSMLKNDGIQFRVLVKIGGYIVGGKEMRNDELKRFLDERLEYRGNYDGNSVMAYAKGTIGMKFGASLVVEGDDISIPECVAYNQLLTCPACEVCY